ncbi:TPA: VapC toxin family PIN domain ribonuclease [Candidatus Delongbacteria bacterium]|nr:VapC toxin family PIN domain ribonuclease [Candidatus Delongbacteria bacterium]
MTGVLVDTSVWIDFFNGTEGSKEADALGLLINENYDICICPMIYQEILQGIKEDRIFNEIKEILLNYTMLSIELMHVTENAVELYRSLRKKGITIRKSNDCLIASYAILNNIPVFHKDRDFDLISSGSKLKIFSLK